MVFVCFFGAVSVCFLEGIFGVWFMCVFYVLYTHMYVLHTHKLDRIECSFFWCSFGVWL